MRYPAEDQRRAAAELERARAEGFVMLPRLVEDGGELRASVRAVCGE